MRFRSTKYSKQLHIFNVIFVYFTNLDGGRILNVLKHPEAKLLLQIIY